VLRGRRTRRTFRLGDPVEVELVEANPITGGMIFRLVDGAADSGPEKGRRPSGKAPRRRR
jgi:ribonuclease R